MMGIPLQLFIAVFVAYMATSSAANDEQQEDSRYIIKLKPGINDNDKGKLVDEVKVRGKAKNVKTFNLGRLQLLIVDGKEEDLAEVDTDKIDSVHHNERVSLDGCRQLDVTRPGQWGLDRIDQYGSVSGGDDAFNYRKRYKRDSKVDVFVLDTGADHFNTLFHKRQFQGGYVAPDIPPDERYTMDDNGHGTMVAGLIVTDYFGVARSSKIKIIPVKVMGRYGNGTVLDMLYGLNYAYTQYLYYRQNRAVVNLSLGMISAETILDEGVAEMMRVGIVVVAAVGNKYTDACTHTPGGRSDAIGVGATDVTDTSADYTNYGTCVDLFAPGTSIESVYKTGCTRRRGCPKYVATRSGTSLSAPFVSGAVADYLATQSVNPTPAQVKSWLLGQAVSGAITWYKPEHGTSPNKMLHYNC